ncbi:flagellar basal body L-ring protein FlgH [Legionella sp. km772]|uniref:flagellar basal body L-ring protein FlgH n=1 Tax=Legionella sp. km772 TaxID=2498111 RepID=UPI000F8E3F4B|nr:flagellar basal body L-ring protein FlgH [Legionella sp. km772]RUR08866.1 flagellar basal body L-ring protein [Legionella sp. km772]
MNIHKLAMLSLVVLSLSGCEALDPPAPGKNPEFSPTYPVTPDPKELRKITGAIYSAETVVPLFDTYRARHVGDILTIVLVESTNAQQNMTTTAKKEDQDKSVNPIFLGRPISLGSGYSLDMDLSNKRQFTGQGQTVQNNKLVGNISVTVAKVLANGNLVVQGEKWIRINQAKEYVQLSGIVRPRDIGSDNAITSDRVANARIYYGGTGQINNANAQGWFSRILWSQLAPT